MKLAAALFCGAMAATATRGGELPGPFGIGSCHVNGRSVDDFERWIPRMAEIDLRFLRSAAVQWNAVEPEPGEWNWETIDAQLAYLADRGISCGALLIGNPKWNEADAPGSLPVNHLAGWSEYVSRTVAHLEGRVKYFEVWNEPPNFTGPDQTPEDYAKIVVAAYQAAKKANPDCLVGLAAKSAHIHYLESVIRAGAKDHFDWISLHPYEVLDGIVELSGIEPVYLNIVPTTRKMLAAANPAKRDVPILFTELGCDAGRHGGQAQAHALVKAYALGIAQGVAQIQWFEGRDGDSGPMGLIDREGEPRPAYHALGRMIRSFGQRPGYLGWIQSDHDGLGFVFEGATGPVMAAWASTGGPAAMDLGAEVEVLDPASGETSRSRTLALDGAPVLVSGLPDDWLARARANRDRPLPWGGDYRNAKSVSLTLGEEVRAEGLHSRAGDSLAEAVVAYGGPARAGDVPGGNLFIVDPSFLSYDSVPLEITAEVRRNENNDNAGFKLVYESSEGFSTAGGWYTIPDNKKWHTVRWRIDDPKFVNYWGYNFQLNSDGNEHNKYFLRKVTVTKIDLPTGAADEAR